MRKAKAMEQYVYTMSAATAELARALDDGANDARGPEFRPPLGTVQRRIVALDGMARPGGMPVEEVARQANRPGGPSTRIVLDTLRRRGIVERLASGAYRLAAEYRRGANLVRVPSGAPGPRVARG